MQTEEGNPVGKSFPELIEDIVWDKDCTYQEALLFYCDKTGTEIEVAAKQVTGRLKEKLMEESRNLFLLKKVQIIGIWDYSVRVKEDI